jgi:tRNA (adenine37-N6)-methyltransferase
VDSVGVTVIGRVENEVHEARDHDWGSVVSRIVLHPGYEAGLRGLESFSHVIVVTYLHQAAFEPGRHLVRRPRGLASMPEVGIFAQRAKDRPNPIGLTAVKLRETGSGWVSVIGLDAIDGTPVLDLKPYFPRYDARPEAVVPEWVERLMDGYF